MIKASFKARSLIKKLDVDFVVGVLGGGAIVGSVGAKLARKPAYSLISTPLDSFVCPKLNKCYILPELNIFKWDKIPKNTDKSFYPLAEDVGSGDAKIALEKLKEYPIFDENKKNDSTCTAPMSPLPGSGKRLTLSWPRERQTIVA